MAVPLGVHRRLLVLGKQLLKGPDLLLLGEALAAEADNRLGGAA
jgi:hypothetical protein